MICPVQVWNEQPAGLTWNDLTMTWDEADLTWDWGETCD